MAARTIPFPISPGIAATKTARLLAPPPTGAAKISQSSRRYRGLQLVTGERRLHVTTNLTATSLEQTRAIVAQVESEIRQQATRQRTSRPGLLLVQPRPQLPALGIPASTAIRSAGRFMLSLIPVGSL